MLMFLTPFAKGEIIYFNSNHLKKNWLRNTPSNYLMSNPWIRDRVVKIPENYFMAIRIRFLYVAHSFFHKINFVQLLSKRLELPNLYI